MKASLIFSFITLLLSFNVFAGGDNGNGGGGGPSIILRTLDDTDIRIISGGHWDLNDFGEDILVINEHIESISGLKLEVMDLNKGLKETPALELIDRGVLKVEPKSFNDFLRENGVDIEELKKRSARLR